jgi:hypothetical protein
MGKYVENNKEIFRACNIPFKEINDREILIKTENVDYQVTLSQLGNNPFMIRVQNNTDNKTEILSKEVFLRKMCRYFKTEFVHWDPKKILVEQIYTKAIPLDITEGKEYTTTWANPIAKWLLKEIINDEDVILVSQKSNREILSKIPDLRIWVKTNK